MATSHLETGGKEFVDVKLGNEPQHPKAFCCPISNRLMVDPVILLTDYQTYDKSNLQEWLKLNGNISPITKQPVSEQQADELTFIPNLAIKSQIDEYNEKRQKEMKKKFKKLFCSVSPGNDDNRNAIRLLLVGDCGVGKSSIKRFIEFNTVNPQFIQPTIGIESCYVKLKQSYKNNDNIIVRITDICGQDRYRSLTRQCYRNVHGVVMICSLDCPDSVKSLKHKWSDDIFEYAPDDIYGIVIINKCDLLNDSSKKSEYESLMRQAIAFANFVGYPVYSTSTITGEYIHTSISDIVYRIIEDDTMYDMIQHHDNLRRETRINLEDLVEQKVCSTSNSCIWALKGIGEIADKTYEKIKTKIVD